MSKRKYKEKIWPKLEGSKKREKKKKEDKTVSKINKD